MPRRMLDLQAMPIQRRRLPFPMSKSRPAARWRHIRRKPNDYFGRGQMGRRLGRERGKRAAATVRAIAGGYTARRLSPMPGHGSHLPAVRLGLVTFDQIVAATGLGEIPAGKQEYACHRQASQAARGTNRPRTNLTNGGQAKIHRTMTKDVMWRWTDWKGAGRSPPANFQRTFLRTSSLIVSIVIKHRHGQRICQPGNSCQSP